jgi:transcriptional regulator with XRE-family HTH domain
VVEQTEGLSEEPTGGPSFARRLRRARMARRWGQLGLAERMFRVGLEYGGSATVESLKGMISKWERGAKLIGQDNLHLLAETLGMPVQDLGVCVDPDFVWRKAAADESEARSGNSAADAGADEGGRAEPDAVRRSRRPR